MAEEKRALAAMVLGMVAFLAGCGGQPAPREPCTSGFVNQTSGSATDSQLSEMWQRAQQTLATQTIPLNPVTAQFQGVPLVSVAPDTRAYQVAPNCITVAAVADLPIAALPQAYKDKGYVDPSGVIQCSGPSGYCHSYTDNQNVWVAKSMVLNDGATGWEFQNIILDRLGYNDSGR